MRYRRKPTLIEAEQWFPDHPVPGVYGLPGQPLCPCHQVGGNHDKPHVRTTHDQIVHIAPGDFVIKEPDGNGYYPCKPDIFEKSYEAEAPSLAREPEWQK